ncbi:MAG: type II toxin-antitoxin system VapC family toxin [Pseudomonadales bacterium]|nr:type II toxin-antitoxin system VapC family toxin [Pseudomonadales bacterium]
MDELISMTKATYMLDTNTCSFLIRKKPEYLLKKLQQTTQTGHPIVVSAITYAELTFGAVNKKASPKMADIVSEFAERLDGVIAWDKLAVEHSTLIKKELESIGTPIGHNDTLIAGHAIAADAILVTDNVREFSRVNKLKYENWVQRKKH